MTDTTFPLRKALTGLLLLLTPAATILAMRHTAGGMLLAPDTVAYATLAVLVLWSPLPISLPAVLLGDARDGFRPGAYGVRRSLALYPYLLGPTSPVRVEAWAHVIGFLAGAAALIR